MDKQAIEYVSPGKSQGHLLLTWINSIAAWIRNHTPSKCEMKLLINSQTSTAASSKIGNG